MTHFIDPYVLLFIVLIVLLFIVLIFSFAEPKYSDREFFAYIDSQLAATVAEDME